MDEELRSIVNRYLINETDFLKLKDRLSEEELRRFVAESIDDLVEERKMTIPPEAKTALVKLLVGSVMSLGPLRPLMEDKSITEIMINGHDQVFVQRAGKIVQTDIQFGSNQELLHTVQKIISSSDSNKRLDESAPYVDFTMGDGSRANVVIPPCSAVGPVVTIRKFKDDIGTVDDLITLKEIDKKIAVLLIAAMKAKFNVIFCGATGAGKTTALNVFSRHIPAEERIVTIEDTPELNLLQKHVVPLLSKPPNIEGKGEITMQDLFINSLRMRPDRIIIGEVRGAEMLDLIQSISSGHSGSLAIVHAESPQDCFNRMVLMMMMTGIRLSTEEIRKQIARAIDVIVHLELYMDGHRRVAYVTEVEYDEETDKITLQDIFKFVETGTTEDGEILGEWELCTDQPAALEKLAKRRISLPEDFFKKV